jgi:hypothetical protein
MSKVGLNTTIKHVMEEIRDLCEDISESQFEYFKSEFLDKQDVVDIDDVKLFNFQSHTPRKQKGKVYATIV